MDENQQAVNVDSGEATAEPIETAVESETTVDESPSSEQEPTHTESEDTEEPASLEEYEEMTDEQISSLSSKAQRRYQQLANENRRLREQVGEGMYKAMQPEDTPALTALPWQNQQAEERIITEQDYQRDIAAKADAVVKARMNEFQRTQQLKEDVRTLESTYEELNPESDSYDAELTDTIVEQFRYVSKGNPQVRLADYADKIMRLRERGRETGKSEVSKKVLQQAAKQAVTTQGEPAITEGSNEEELIKLRKEGRITFDEFERRVQELGK